MTISMPAGLLFTCGECGHVTYCNHQLPSTTTENGDLIVTIGSGFSPENWKKKNGLYLCPRCIIG